MKRLALLTICSLALVGCVSDPMGKTGWQGFSPNGDYDLVDVDGTLTTPWGTQHLHIGRLSKRVDPMGTNTLTGLAQPPMATTTVSGTSTVAPTK